jgi:hypothetical protein
MFDNLLLVIVPMRLLLICVLCLSPAVRAEPAKVVLPPPSLAAHAQAEALPLRARLDKEAIRAAIAATPEERNANPRRPESGTLSATPYQTFSKEFAGARLPDCLHSEGLKNQPTFFLSGFIALPFIAVARLRGVCR